MEFDAQNGKRSDRGVRMKTPCARKKKATARRHKSHRSHRSARQRARAKRR
jgi:hypothetical protein